jgi:hypothetical protein
VRISGIFVRAGLKPYPADKMERQLTQKVKSRCCFNALEKSFIITRFIAFAAD